MGRKAVDITGVKYGRWTVVERSGSDKDSKPMWLCKCECGNSGIVNGAALKRGDSTSCGCYVRERSTKHGMYKSRLNHIYRGMKQRCYNPQNGRYSYYGGRGIKICDEWLGADGFIHFMDWAIKSGYTDDLSIDRIDSNGNYEPGNCQWVNEETQCRNRRVKATNKSGATGVTQRTATSWRAFIRYDGKNHNLGTFHSFDDAVRARKEAEEKYW